MKCGFDSITLKKESNNKLYWKSLGHSVEKYFYKNLIDGAGIMLCGGRHLVAR